MLINAKNLLHLPVFTESEEYLGKIIDFDLEIDSQSILKYYVKGSGLLKFLDKDLELIIFSEQVVSISKEKMVVVDNVFKEKTEEKIKKKGLEFKKPEIVLPSQQN